MCLSVVAAQAGRASFNLDYPTFTMQHDIRKRIGQVRRVLLLALTFAVPIALPGSLPAPSRAWAQQTAGSSTRGTATGRCPGRILRPPGTAALRRSRRPTPRPEADLELLDRSAPGPRGSAAGRGRHPYVVTPYPNVLYAFDLTQEGYPLRWKIPAGRRCQRARHRLLRRDQPRRVSTPTARSSTTCSTATPSRSTPRQAARSGTPRSPTSPTAKRRPWRRSSSRTA